MESRCRCSGRAIILCIYRIKVKLLNCFNIRWFNIRCYHWRHIISRIIFLILLRNRLCYLLSYCIKQFLFLIFLGFGKFFFYILLPVIKLSCCYILNSVLYIFNLFIIFIRICIKFFCSVYYSVSFCIIIILKFIISNIYTIADIAITNI